MFRGGSGSTLDGSSDVTDGDISGQIGLLISRRDLFIGRMLVF